jgi:hypothetical protein
MASSSNHCQQRRRRPITPSQSPTIAAGALTRYIPRMRFENVWVEQCRATKAIKRRFGATSAVDYLIGEKLISFADAARDHPAFARELPKFLAAIWHTFNEYEIAGYVATRKPPSKEPPPTALVHALVLAAWQRDDARRLRVGVPYRGSQEPWAVATAPTMR